MENCCVNIFSMYKICQVLMPVTFGNNRYMVYSHVTKYFAAQRTVTGHAWVNSSAPDNRHAN